MRIEELFPEYGLEDKNTEYKGIIKEGKSDKGKNLEIGWLKTIVAFANTEGGKLIIGVEDDTHKIVALDKKTADKIILMIHRQIKERIDPEIPYDIKGINAVTGSEPRYIIEVTVENQLAREQIENIKGKILSTLKLHLQNNDITLSIRIAEHQEQEKTLSRREQFELMEKENPSVKKLRELLNLQLA